MVESSEEAKCLGGRLQIHVFRGKKSAVSNKEVNNVPCTERLWFTLFCYLFGSSFINEPLLCACVSGKHFFHIITIPQQFLRNKFLPVLHTSFSALTTAPQQQ